MASDAASSSPTPQTSPAQPPTPAPPIQAPVPQSAVVVVPDFSSTSAVPATTSALDDDRRANSGRRYKYTPTEDLIIVREVAAAKAHVAPYGQTRALYEQVSGRCKENRGMTCTVKWKQCQDRYDRLQEAFDKEDGLTHLRSGIGGGELNELNELLSQMQEAKDDLKKEKNAKREKIAKEEEEKERIGKEIVAASLSRKRKLSPDYKSNEEGSGSDSGGSDKERKKRRKSRGGAIGGELAGFGDSLKESDLARVDLERDQLSFERHKFDAEKEERSKDREERRIKRQENNEMELKKLQALLVHFRHSRSELFEPI